jgi:Cu-Zn family superoxide dismutase
VEDSALEGEAALTETYDGVQVTAAIENAPPGTHAIRIDDRGDCGAVIGASAGETASPEETEDSEPAPGLQLGDIASFAVDERGNGQLATTVAGASLAEGEPMSLLGKTLVIHQVQDAAAGVAKNWQQPIACAVIGRE